MTNNRNYSNIREYEMGILSNLFNRDKDKELTELREMIATIDTTHAKLYADVDSLKEEVEDLKAINNKLVDCIVKSSDHNAMKTNLRLSKFYLTPGSKIFTNVDKPPRKP